MVTTVVFLYERLITIKATFGCTEQIREAPVKRWTKTITLPHIDRTRKYCVGLRGRRLFQSIFGLVAIEFQEVTQRETAKQHLRGDEYIISYESS